MRRSPTPRASGFALLEALIALIVAAVAIVGIVKLQGYISKGSAEALARSEATTLIQDKLDLLRTRLVTRDAFFAEPTTQSCADITPNASSTDPDRPEARSTNTSFHLCWALAAPVGASESRAATLNIAWTDSDGTAQTLALQSVLAWDDPLGQAISSVPPGGTMIAPVGAAKKGTKVYSPVPTTQISDAGNGLKYHTAADNTVELIDANGKVLLYLDPKNGQPQAFTTISGRVYFDKNAGNNKVPPPAKVKVRLSSEGICVQDSSSTGVKSLDASFDYFEYTCYVGPGWYGNVGVTISDSVNGSAANPTICVGDSNFNNGLSDGTLISAHSVESATRTYRGFRAVVQGNSTTYLSTGVAGGTTYPNSGTPLPSAFPSYYGSLSAAQNYFNHHFLVTSVTSKTQSCRTKMPTGMDSPFALNAGKYYCINPHNVSDPAVCPSIWPNFESEVGTGGTISYPLDVTVNGGGQVTASPAVIDCGTLCSASLASGTQVVLTAAPSTGQSFSGWSGACSGSALSCTLTMDAAKTVAAAFSATVFTETLTVTKTGTGGGTVTSSSTPAIDCGTTCSVGFSSPTSVILTASAAPGSNFAGWSGGGCSGTASTCTVSVSGAVSVTATFNTSSPTHYLLTISKTGSGTVVRTSPSNVQINCGSTCSDSVTNGTAVTLTATPATGYVFTGWSGGGCSGTGSCTVTVNAATTVTASFGVAACNTTISGSLKDKNDAVLEPILTVGGASAGSCSKPTNNATNYNCTLTAAQGSAVTLRGQQQGGNGSGTIYTVGTTADCQAKTVNF